MFHHYLVALHKNLSSRVTLLRQLFLLAFLFNQGLPQCIMFLCSVLFSMSVFLVPTSPISFFTTFKNFLFSLPLFLFPDNSIFIPPQPASLNFIPNRSTLTVPLVYSFLILSFLVTPIVNLNIFIFATSISSTCFFVIATISSHTPLLVSPLNCTLFFLL